MPNIVESRDEQYDELIAGLVKYFRYTFDGAWCVLCGKLGLKHEHDCPVAIVERQTGIKLGEEDAES